MSWQRIDLQEGEERWTLAYLPVAIVHYPEKGASWFHGWCVLLNGCGQAHGLGSREAAKEAAWPVVLDALRRKSDACAKIRAELECAMNEAKAVREDLDAVAAA